MKGYHDPRVILFLKYGFPLGHNGRTGCNEIPKNHKGARDFPKHISTLLNTEVATKATIGPFKNSPFGKSACFSPLNSVPKKDSVKRHLIVDLSIPRGNSINDGIDKDNYVGLEEKLTLPSIDALAEKIAQLGKNCRVFKIDLSRAYRQIFIDPLNIAQVSYVFDGKMFFNCTLTMGAKSSARCRQMVSSVVVFIYAKNKFFAVNYIDDFGSACKAEEADAAFSCLRSILVKMGLQEALDKAVLPSTFMVFLGIQVNTITMTLTIPESKWLEICQVLREWQQKQAASLKETQVLTGLLNFACRCVRSGRVYLSRILNFLRTLPTFGKKEITQQVREDISWWQEFAPTFNGVSLILENHWSQPDVVFSSDSCLTGGGAFCGGRFFHFEFGQNIVA